MKLLMILVCKGTRAPVSKDMGQCPRIAPPFRRPWLDCFNSNWWQWPSLPKHFVCKPEPGPASLSQTYQNNPHP